jgi:hypothetical protein
MAGATLDQAGRIAGRTSGDSTVAYALPSRKAAGVESRRGRSICAPMAELERLPIISATSAASATTRHFHHARTVRILRERVLRAVVFRIG